MKIRALIIALALFGLSTASWGTQITFEIDTKFSGGGSGTPSYRATFTDGVGYVELKMEATGTAGVNQWYFNLDPLFAGTIDCSTDLVRVSGSIMYSSCVSDPGGTLLKADGDGTFDFWLEFNDFGEDDGPSIYNIITSSLRAEDFNFTSRSTGGGPGPFYAAVKTDEGGSAWYGDGKDDNVVTAEPATLTLMGLGLAGLGFMRRKMKA